MSQNGRMRGKGAAVTIRDAGQPVILLIPTEIVQPTGNSGGLSITDEQIQVDYSRDTQKSVYAVVTYHPGPIAYDQGGEVQNGKATFEFPALRNDQVDSARGIKVRTGEIYRKASSRFSEGGELYIVEADLVMRPATLERGG